jgi:hypothetical protein
MWRRGEDAAAGRQTPTGLPAISSVVPVPVSESAEERAEEEVLLALRMMCQSGLRHPLHGHSYSRYTALRPRVCCSCEAPVFGPFSKACHCLTCGIIVHRQCVQRITRVPCGSYRGLRDPEGLHSRVATAGGNVGLGSSSGNEASVAGTEAAARSERKADTDSSLGGQEAVEEEFMWQRGSTGVHENEELEKSAMPGDPDAADAASSFVLGSSPSDNSSSLGTGGGARRMTYDALARVGALVGSMVSGGGGPSGGDAKEATVMATSGSSFTSSSIFSFSTLRGAGAVAGAYTGYRQQGGDRRHSSIGGSSEAATPPSPVAMAWSRLAQRLSRPEGGGGGGGAGAFLDLATFARSLEEVHKEKEKENGEKPDNASSPGRRLVDSSTPLIGQILRCPQTPPGFVWAACLDHFAARHAASAGAKRAPSPDLRMIKTEGEVESEVTAEAEETSVPAGSCCEDAAAIIHEVALVLMEYVPGLLGSSLEAYEEAFEAVETEIMTTLYPSVLRECQNQVRALSRAVEAWYRQQPAEHAEHEEEGGPKGGGALGADAHYHKAAQELVGMSREVTGRKKVQRVLGACLALGEGNLVMTADELLPALGRVVRLARVPALPAHLAFIEETCDTGALLGAEGYALTSLQVVVSLIITPPTEDGRGAEEEEEDEEGERERCG